MDKVREAIERKYELRKEYNQAKTEYEIASGKLERMVSDGSEESEREKRTLKGRVALLKIKMDEKEEAVREADKAIEKAKEERDKEHQEKLARLEKEQAKKAEAKAKKDTEAKAKKAEAKAKKGDAGYCERHPKVCRGGMSAGLIGAGVGMAALTGGAMGSELIAGGANVAVGDSRKRTQISERPESKTVQAKKVQTHKAATTQIKKPKTVQKPKAVQTKTKTAPAKKVQTHKTAQKKKPSTRARNKEDRLSSPLLTSTPKKTAVKAKTKGKSKTTQTKKPRKKQDLGSPLLM